MRIKINRKRFGELVSAVAAVCRKSTSNVTDGIHLATDDLGRLLATATDYDMTIQAWAELDEELEPGAMVLPGKLLGQVIAALPEVELLELYSSGDDGGGVLLCGEALFELNGYKAKEFPGSALDGFEIQRSLDVPREHLAAGLRATVPFALGDDSRPALCGVLLEVDRGRLTLCATDGHRLGRYAVEVAPSPVSSRQIIPARMARAMASALAHSEDAPQLGQRDRELVAIIGRVSMRARAIDESFPDYMRVIPSVNAKKAVTVDRAKLVEAARRCAILGQGEKGVSGATLKMTIGDEAGIRLEAGAANTGGKSRDAVGLFSTRPAGVVRLGVSSGYLIHALDVFSSKLVTIQADDQFSPLLVTSDEEPAAVHVLMPVRL